MLARIHLSIKEVLTAYYPHLRHAADHFAESGSGRRASLKNNEESTIRELKDENFNRLSNRFGCHGVKLGHDL
jgi:hypothetical protein